MAPTRFRYEVPGPHEGECMHDPGYVDPREALGLVQHGHRVYIHEAAMAPPVLIEALVERLRALENVEIVQLHTEAPAPYVAPDLTGHARLNALFVGSNVREAVNAGRADYTPAFLSEIPRFFEDGTLPIDVALLQVSPPDRHGFCSLGTSVATARSAADNASIVIAEVNPQVPRTRGNTAVHISSISAAVRTDHPLFTHPPEPFGEVERMIGHQIAELIPDGATLQMGIGAIPNAVLSELGHKHDLGIHTEMFTDGVVDLVERGVITNRYKRRFHRRIVTSFVSGSQRLFDFVDENPFVEFHPSSIVNDVGEIRQLNAMIAINSAIEVDLTGQVCADSIGTAIYSGIGGQMDFMRGAVLSPGGKAFIALPSTARGGTVSRIVNTLSTGAGVVTTRGHVEYLVTEYGVARLRGKSIRQRAEELTAIAHPDFRGELRAAAVERRLFIPE
jgi:4-hydroxybutyrate CoA-transferase